MDKLQAELLLSDFQGKISKKLDMLIKKVDASMLDLSECKRGLDFINQSFERFKEEMKKMAEDQCRIVADSQKLQEDVSKLKIEVEGLRAVVEDFEYVKVRDNVELSQVQMVEGEQVEDVVVKIMKAAGVKLDRRNIKSAYRRKSKLNGEPGDLVVKMDSVESKSLFIRSVRGKRVVNSHIGFTGNNRGIFAREMLTIGGKDLFFKALTFKKEKQWKFLWTSEGKVFLRKGEGERCFRIKTAEDLLKL